MPNELSGGEQRRIVIARAILNRPDIILADEPTGNLDTETGRKIVELLKSICATGSAIMMTTHNLHLLSASPLNADCQEIPQMHPLGFLYSFHLIWSHAACPALHI